MGLPTHLGYTSGKGIDDAGIVDKLINNGFIHYEVSNFSKDGYQSKHNFTYWKDERYYGIGLGAAGYSG